MSCPGISPQWYSGYCSLWVSDLPLTPDQNAELLVVVCGSHFDDDLVEPAVVSHRHSLTARIADPLV